MREPEDAHLEVGRKKRPLGEPAAGEADCGRTRAIPQPSARHDGAFPESCYAL